jgi:hypothetical protein
MIERQAALERRLGRGIHWRAVLVLLLLLRRRSVIETAGSRRERPRRPSGVMAPLSGKESSGCGGCDD